MEETKKCKCCGRELPLSEFSRNWWGVLSTCKDCVAKKRKEGKENKKALRNFDEEIAKAKKARLSDFTPRELMLRLKELGYIGYIDVPQMTYKRVDLSSDFWLWTTSIRLQGSQAWRTEISPGGRTSLTRKSIRLASTVSRSRIVQAYSGSVPPLTNSQQLCEVLTKAIPSRITTHITLNGYTPIQGRKCHKNSDFFIRSPQRSPSVVKRIAYRRRETSGFHWQLR